jgi:cell division protein FtsB
LIEIERENDEFRQERRRMEHEIDTLTDERDLLKVQDKVKY